MEEVSTMPQSVQASDLVLWYYWPNVESKHIGYAYHKYYLLGLTSIVLFLFVLLLLPLLHVLPFIYLLVMSFFFLFWIIFLTKSYLQKIVFCGMYEVDSHGRPVGLLAKPSEEREKGFTALHLGFPMSRRRFLRTVQQ